MMDSNGEVLNSWKEVAAYLGRGVRTVQRWELELGLPVRRPRGKSRSAVIAFKPELDKWLHNAPVEQLEQESPKRLSPASRQLRNTHQERQAKLHQSAAILTARTQALVARSNDLCQRLQTLQKSIFRTASLASAKLQRNGKASAPMADGSSVAATQKAIAS